ncbi:MAG: DUF11 domain-containing protein [Rhodothermales bacterium]|nr:DUF11 domain-containing protein [Rhodothermales bacterium]MBO6779934.1 DUF11 domain-containing protein [Rhodothermales bacterium]
MALLPCLAQVSQAQDFYVAPGGNDAAACTTPGTACQTISAAIGKASSGDEISVAAGTYAESVVIDKALTLNGAQSGTATSSRTAGSGTESILDVRGLPFGFDVQADNVIIDGFDILGDASTWAGVRMFGTREFVDIRYNFIHGMANENPNSSSFSYAYGIWALGGGSVGSRGSIQRLTINANHIYDLGGAALGSGHVSGGAGLFLMSLEGNNTGTGALIAANTFSDMADGSHTLWPQPGLGAALLQDDDNGRIDSGVQITANTYSDLVLGVVMQTDASRVTESNSSFSNVDVLVKQLDGLGEVNEAPLQPFNTRDDDHLVVFPASGVTSKAYFPTGQDRYVSSTGSDNFNICTDASNPCRTIQWAHDRAFAGETVHVGAGTFAESVTATKALSFQGAGAGTAVTSRTSGSASETILDASGQAVGFDVQASDVSIDGFDVTGNHLTWAGVKLFGAFDGVTVQNSFFRDYSGANPNSSSFTYAYGIWGLGGGSVGNRGAITDLTIQGNEVNNLGGSAVTNGLSGGAGVFLMSISGASAGAGATISGNRFVGLKDGTHGVFATQPGVGVAILQDDDGGADDGGASVTGNTYSGTELGVVLEAINSSVSEQNSSFTGASVFVLNASSLASVNATALEPYALSTSPSLNGFSAPAGSVAYFSNAQDAFDSSAGAATVQVQGNVSGTGTATATSMELDAGQLVIIQNGVEIFRGSPSAVNAIVITGTAGNDTLDINLNLLGSLPAGGIAFNAGAGFDTITLSGGSGLNTVTHTFFNANDGTVDVDGTLVATYTGLDPIIDNLSAVNRVFTFTGGSESVTLSDDGVAGNGYSFIDSDMAESVTFLNPTTSLTVNLGSGDDTITMTALDSGFAVDPVINGDDGEDRFNITPSANYAITVNGGIPTGAPGDVLDIALVGTTGASLTNVGGSGSWTFTNRNTVSFSGIETQIDDPSTADLALSKTPETVVAYPEDVLVFTITVSNNGPSDATGIEITDDLPSRLTCACSPTVSEGATAYSGGAGGTITWNGIDLAAGESATMTYRASVSGSTPGTETNSALIAVATPTDPVASNNSASSTIEYRRPVRFPENVLVQAVDFRVNSGGMVETFAGTFNQGLYRSLPGFIGSRWAPVRGGLPSPLVVNEVLVASTGTMYLAAHGWAGMYSSTDGGRSWDAVDFGGPTLTIVHAVAESELDGILYISADDGQIWRLSGGFWDFAGRLPEGAAHTPWTMVADPAVSGRVYAGTFGDGVFRSDDYGETWVRISEGAMPNNGSIHVFDLAFDPELTPTTLWAGTSRGIFYSQDSGVTWVDASSGLGKFTEVRSIAFGPVDPLPTATGRMYVATWGGGVFELPSDRATLPSWTNVTLRLQQVGVVGVTPDGKKLWAGPATGGAVGLSLSSVSTDAEPPAELPTGLSLHQNYPNPFNPSTNLSFALPQSAEVRLSVHDVMGREVAVLVDGLLPAGEHSVVFDASRLPSGPYVYRLRTPGASLDRVMMLLK